MARMRDKLTHAYFGINLAVVWKTVTEDLPTLEPAVAKVLREQIAHEQQQENEYPLPRLPLWFMRRNTKGRAMWPVLLHPL